MVAIVEWFPRRKLGIGVPPKGTFLTMRHLLRRTTMLMPHFCVLLKLLLLMIMNTTYISRASLMLLQTQSKEVDVHADQERLDKNIIKYLW
ncbi:hypothetical protein BT93_F1983 [Corymbia citriodora subsp. variegata]|nr:hypothetical protein BT93_F1983 [Corymbia citriodora subsp. variegata]